MPLDLGIRAMLDGLKPESADAAVAIGSALADQDGS